MKACAKVGCGVPVEPIETDYCTLHRPVAGGCLSALLVFLLVLVVMMAVIVAFAMAIPTVSKDGKSVCWIIDPAMPWEHQKVDRLACVPVGVIELRDAVGRR